MKFSEMPYSRPNMDQILADVEALTSEMQSAASAKEQLEILRRMEAIYRDFDTMKSISHVRNTVNTRDEFYDGERKFFDETSPLFGEKINCFQNAILDSKFRPELEKELGDLLFLNMEMDRKSFSPEIVPLLQEENALAAQYQKLYASARIEFDGKICNVSQLTPYMESPDRAVRKAAVEAQGKFFDEHQAEFDEIFDKLVKNRTEQAKKLGFNNFVELGYLRRGRNCYTAKDVENFRKQVVKELVPVTMEIKKEQAQRIGIPDFKFYDDSFVFPDGNPVPQGTPDEILAAGKQMYTEMAPETADFIKMMFDMDLFDVLAKDGKAPGGYCTSLPGYHCPFIFSNFNGTSGDVDVLTHEAGHAFADMVADKEYMEGRIKTMYLTQPSMEGCESHSMSMEFLTAPWHHLFFKHQTEKYELAHAQDALIFIPYGSMVDHFQEIVYSHPEMTPQERNEAWAKLEKEYRPYLDFENLPFYGRGAGWQRQLHIYLYPFYYIDYCMAQTVALQIWVLSMKNREEAWSKYMQLVKMAGTKTFVDLVKAIGLKAPVEDGCIDSIIQDIQQWLKQNKI